MHHALHVAATGEADGYYADYFEDAEKLGRALAEGFSFQGEVMSYRDRARGEPSAALPPLAFVSFIQNHDQIGNRAFGERLSAIAPAPAVRAAAAIYLLLPQVPMLFMGEEWAAPQPFLFFCDFGAALADAVRDGRRAEFARFPQFKDAAKRQRIPDPMAETTFLSSKLDWNDIGREPHAAWRAWYRAVLAIRRAEILPLLASITHGGRYEVIGKAAVSVRWSVADGRELALAANLSADPVDGFPPVDDKVLLSEGNTAANGAFGPHSVRWSIRGSVDG